LIYRHRLQNHSDSKQRSRDAPANI
jgi:hypothetical protein